MEHFLELMPNFVTVGQARGRAHIAGNQQLVVPGDNAARTPPAAGGAF